MSSRRDYKVSWRDAASIEAIAQRWRMSAGVDRSTNFDVVKFVQEELHYQVSGLTIKKFGRKDSQKPPAFVRFDPLELHVDDRVWLQAQFKNSVEHEDARHIVAHEIGHIVLHRDQKKSFSSGSTTVPSYYVLEESSEWQANTFARYFLLSNRHVRDLADVDAITTFCRVPVALAEEALRELNRGTQNSRVASDFCGRCGGLSTVEQGCEVRCSECGTVMNMTVSHIR